LSEVELIAAGLGLANIVLISLRSVWNYAFGIPMVILYGFVFFEARLYSDAILQVYFLLMQGYGLWNWMHGRADDGLVRVGTLSNEARLATAGVTLAASLAIGFVFARYTDAALPWIDAPIAAMSVIAQYLMSVRKIENWVLWIAVDLIAVVIYPIRGLYLTTGLYAIFLAVSVFGLWQWLQEYRREALA
jgi:nicotinamide mononucleotide transporter